jgi:hypothetical protein
VTDLLQGAPAAWCWACFRHLSWVPAVGSFCMAGGWDSYDFD